MASRVKTYNEKYVREKVRKIFEAAQEQYGHRKLMEKCRKLLKKCEVEDLFLQEFTSALRYVFFYNEKTAVENILSFVSKFVAMSYVTSSDQNKSDSTIDECSPFVTSILEFLFRSHKAYSSDARLRSIQLLDKILSGVPENSLISDEIWQKLKETVLCRLQDKNIAVRAQAVITARKLQDPKNSNCEIIKALIFHFNDPSAAVRRAVVSAIALNKLTITHVLARTRDVNDNVRRNAYLVFCKIKVVHLTIKFRVTILERGLQDRSEMVRKCVEQILVVRWLENFNKDALKFLEALDVVNCSETAIKTVLAILRTHPKDEIMKQLPIDEKTHLIPKDKMTPESVLLWRSLAHHFWVEGNEDDLDAILPSLTLLCDHIREFYKLEETANVDLNEEEQWAEVKKKETLMHLLQLLKVFDLSDEMGRLKLKELITDMLISSRISNCQVKLLVELLVPVIPSKDAFINHLTEVISEIRQPMRTVVKEMSQKEKMERDLKISDLKLLLNELREQEYKAVCNKNYAEAQDLKNQIEATEVELKAHVDQPVALTQEVSEEKNDPVVLCKCLSVLVEMIRLSNVKSLTPRLLNLKENFLNQCMSSRDLLTQSLAIEALSQFCILDKELAKENLIRFILMISEDGDNEITIPTLKGVFDIIHTHGLECFEHLHPNDDNEEQISKNRIFREESPFFEEPKESFHSVRCLKNLNALLSYKNNDALKSIAYEGLCKLLVSGIIYSPSVLTRIIIKGFSPIIECEYEDFIRQTFMVFFPVFAATTPRSQEMIEEAFLPAIKSIENAPLGTPEADISPKSLITFLLAYTRPDFNKHAAKSLHVHNHLALSIGHDIYKRLCQGSDSVFFIHIYLKALNELDVSLESESFVQQLRTLTDKIEENLKDTNCLRLLLNFKKKVENKEENNIVSSVENTLATTRDTRASKRSTSKSVRILEGSGDCCEVKKSAKKHRSSGLKAVSETLESSSVHESSSSPLPGAASEMIIPESPEMSE